MKKKIAPCPHCGYCPSCGRAKAGWAPYPAWPNYPIWINTAVGTGTTTVTTTPNTWTTTDTGTTPWTHTFPTGSASGHLSTQSFAPTNTAALTASVNTSYTPPTPDHCTCDCEAGATPEE